jgi:hypothetical protein
MKPSIGRIVIYKITDEQAKQINRRRTDGASIAERIKSEKWPIGAQAHIGNSAYPGEGYPLIAVRIWPDEYGPGVSGVNGQVLLDANDVLWVTSVGEGNENGQWHWPARMEV